VRCLGGPNPPVQAHNESELKVSTLVSGAGLGNDGEHRRIIIVGIPGVGKTTVVNKLVEQLKALGISAGLINYGTTMMEEASTRHGLKSRDEMRTLPVELQRSLQVYAAERISHMTDRYVIIDTHLFIVTKEGFWPGIPVEVLGALKPTHLVLVSASLEEIKSRRESDATRIRDKSTIESLSSEMDAAKSLLFASSLLCGCPALIVTNSAGQADEVAKKIINSVFLK
jgi:adenylate kinase